jgi:hypothetical protein
MTNTSSCNGRCASLSVDLEQARAEIERLKKAQPVGEQPDVDPRAVCGVLRQFLGDNTKSIVWLRRALVEEGVLATAHERAVLVALRNVNTAVAKNHAQSPGPVGALFRAALAWREATK